MTDREPASNPEFRVVPVTGPFEFASSIAFLPDGSILITERPGVLKLIDPRSGARRIL